MFGFLFNENKIAGDFEFETKNRIFQSILSRFNKFSGFVFILKRYRYQIHKSVYKDKSKANLKEKKFEDIYLTAIKKQSVIYYFYDVIFLRLTGIMPVSFRTSSHD